jgi:D-serine deaminase-like pyridoxal phosphate-dependent protein
MKEQAWYALEHPEEVDSPALLVYKDRVASNIQSMIRIAGDSGRLIPHVKTHKMAEIVKMQMEAGIRQFKCATIAEAEMLAGAGATQILVAYQLTGPKAARFLSLVRAYPQTEFASLADNMESASLLNDLFGKENSAARVFIDVDAGMHRTGIAPDDSLYNLYIHIERLPHISCMGLHVYDGHVRQEDFELRRKQSESGMAEVKAIGDKITGAGYPKLMIIAGGTPTFTVHSLDRDLFCSPGTCLLWDYGYDVSLKEQPFEFAALLLTRVISKPARGLITTDLGHKSVAAENPISQRIFFLNLEDYTVRSQSEEHLVLEVKDWDQIQTGDVLYGVPYHICPSVALYDEANVIENGKVTGTWSVAARRRKLNF